MDWSVRPDSRIAGFPKLLRGPALVARNVAGLRLRRTELLRRYTFKGDGLATIHYSPFLDDEEFTRAYESMVGDWLLGYPIDMRWRLWVVTRLARAVQHLRANLAEFGAGRGGHSYMVLSTTTLDPSQKYFLFDTFAGIPETNLTEVEAAGGFAGEFANTSADLVRKRLSAWEEKIEICEGDVFDTLDEVETGKLAFCHLDLNAAAPTRHVLEYIQPRMVSGGMIVFDDYGYTGHEEQRIMVDSFFEFQPEEPIALPTGQGMVIKQ